MKARVPRPVGIPLEYPSSTLRVPLEYPLEYSRGTRRRRRLATTACTTTRPSALSSEGSLGVLTGYSRGTVRRRWRSRRRSLPTPSHSSPTAWSRPRPSPGTQVWGTPRGNPRVLTEYHKGYSRGYSMVLKGYSKGTHGVLQGSRVCTGTAKGNVKGC